MSRSSTGGGRGDARARPLGHRSTAVSGPHRRTVLVGAQEVGSGAGPPSGESSHSSRRRRQSCRAARTRNSSPRAPAGRTIVPGRRSSRQMTLLSKQSQSTKSTTRWDTATAVRPRAECPATFGTIVPRQRDRLDARMPSIKGDSLTALHAVPEYVTTDRPDGTCRRRNKERTRDERDGGFSTCGLPFPSGMPANTLPLHENRLVTT